MAFRAVANVHREDDVGKGSAIQLLRILGVVTEVNTVYFARQWTGAKSPLAIVPVGLAGHLVEVVVTYLADVGLELGCP